jgi:ribosomal protein S18 acetylase RimI-like enzyme
MSAIQKLTIRPMQPGDIPACAGIVASTPLWQRYGVTPESAAARLTAGHQDGATILVADDGDGNLLGFVWLVKRGAFDLSGYIRWIAVAASRRSSGVGRRLLTAAEEHVRQTSRDIFLLCSDFNVDARHFYEQNGYIQVGALPDYVVPGIAELIYWKRLSPRQE